jgi:hypothetical protein
VTALQNQTEKLVLDFLEKVPWVTPESKKMINDCAHTCKKAAMILNWHHQNY